MSETAVTGIEQAARAFVPWPKIARLNRTIIITEKIDGTNSAVVVTPDDVYAQSRNRIITPDADNHGFAAWVDQNAGDLHDQLGQGRHFGEWWGYKIGKRYSAHLSAGDKRFSLFDTTQWTAAASDGWRCHEAPLCHVVPTLAVLNRFDTVAVDEMVELLREHGSGACPGASAEGVVIYHPKSATAFKVTTEKDAEWKGRDRV